MHIVIIIIFIIVNNKDFNCYNNNSKLVKCTSQATKQNTLTIVIIIFLIAHNKKMNCSLIIIIIRSKNVANL